MKLPSMKDVAILQGEALGFCWWIEAECDWEALQVALDAYEAGLEPCWPAGVRLFRDNLPATFPTVIEVTG